MNHMQIPLALHLRDDANFDNFLAGCNAHIVESLKQWVDASEEPFVYCYGESGSGRTHLLQACCHLANQYNKSIFYLPLAQHAQYSLAVFQELESYQMVCVDDVDAIIGNRAWEEAFFHFYNRARDRKTALLISAPFVPQQFNCVLPDLQSRLTSGLILEIKNLSDAEKIQALQLRATRRGFDLSEEVVAYVVNHYSRNMRDLFHLFEKLDQASLIAKRKITVPFVKQVI